MIKHQGLVQRTKKGENSNFGRDVSDAYIDHEAGIDTGLSVTITKMASIAGGTRPQRYFKLYKRLIQREISSGHSFRGFCMV